MKLFSLVPGSCCCSLAVGESGEDSPLADTLIPPRSQGFSDLGRQLSLLAEAGSIADLDSDGSIVQVDVWSAWWHLLSSPKV